MTASIDTRLRTILSSILAGTDHEGREITAETTPAELGLDSLRKWELVFAIEDGFGIVIADGAVEGLRTWADVVRLVEPQTVAA